MIIFCLVFILVSVSCFLCAFLFFRSQRLFNRNCQYTSAVVIGYRVEDYSSFDSPRVRFLCDGKEVVTGTQAIRSRNRPQPGTQVQIAYKKGSFAGHDTWQVRIMKDGKIGNSEYVFATVISIIGMVFLIAALTMLLKSY